jgi:replicative DNA helicase
MSGDPREDEVSRLRVPPHSTEAEQAVLGSVLLDNGAWDRMGDLLSAKDFYRHEHRLIFEVVSVLVNANKPADAITVFERLQAQGKAADIGGLAYLLALIESVAGSANARRYAEIVRDRAMKRALIGVMDEIASQAFGGDGAAADLLDAAATAIGGLERSGARREPKHLSKVLVQRIDRINEVYEGGIEAGWPTRIPWLDRRLSGGLRPGMFYVLAARPSIGKSSLAEKIGTGMALHDGLPVLFLSQEMPEGEVADRAIAEIGGVDYEHLQTAKLDDIEWGMLSAAVETGSQIPFYVDDQPGLTLRQIRVKARSVPGLKVLILDYLQLSEGEGRNDSRAAEIGAISRGLKKLAKEMGIAVIALSQLNRKVEERPGKRPTMADLRDSGEIEQDADVIMFLWPVRDFPSGDAKLVGLELGKNRQGKRGEIGLDFRGKYQQWGESTESIRGAASKGGFE